MANRLSTIEVVAIAIIILSVAVLAFVGLLFGPTRRGHEAGLL